MKFIDLKKGSKVVDRWWTNWGTGVVLQKSATKVSILFRAINRAYTYDKQHVQFLEKYNAK